MPEPLRSKTMTLAELQKATLKLIRATRKQLGRPQWRDGMSDDEFEEKVLDQLETKIKDDMEMVKGGG